MTRYDLNKILFKNEKTSLATSNMLIKHQRLSIIKVNLHKLSCTIISPKYPITVNYFVFYMLHVKNKLG